MWVDAVTVSDIASIATALGVGVGAVQLIISQRQTVTAFEDSLNHEYRKLVSTIPTQALLGEDLDQEAHEKHLDEFYHYFDLCNSQVFLRQKKRISKKTWDFWCDGIRSNLERPAFRRAWTNIGVRAGDDFSELKKLIAEGYQTDPKSWKSLRRE